MESINVISELKYRLKEWEKAFIIKHGRKPTKYDISSNKEAEKLYIQYARLKKCDYPSAAKKTSRSQPNLTSGVWGSVLLKVNATPLDVEDHLEEKSHQQKQAVIKTFDYRENIRKNVDLNQVKVLHLNPNAKLVNNCKQKVNVCDSMNSSKEQSYPEDETCNNNNSSDTKFKQLPPNILNTATLSKKKQTKCRSASRKAGCSSKAVDTLWLNKHSDDLSDLMNFQKSTVSLIEDDCPALLESTVECVSVVTSTQEPNLNETVMNTSGLTIAPERSVSKQTQDTSLVSVEPNTISQLETFSTSELSPSVGNTEVQNAEPEATSKICLPSGSVGSSQSLVSKNFVRLNMKPKTFCARSGRGKYLRKKIFRDKLAKKGLSFKSGWKGRSGGMKNREFKTKAESKCFKCGGLGHWARDCSSISTVKRQAITESLPTEEECGDSISDILKQHHTENVDNSREDLDCIPFISTVKQSGPVYTCDAYDEVEVLSVLKKFGFSQFRFGQAQAIKRILCGKPTLVVLSTGLGKSLCYQLPAHMYFLKKNAITLVVSPLVSLMQDQISSLPKFLKATCFHSAQTADQRKKTLEEVVSGKISLLLISPETFTSWAGMSPQTSPLHNFPPISFVCVDECHCLAEWSHSFRPSYLRLCQVLKEQLNIHSLVGLTATATTTSCHSIAKQLGVSDKDDGVILSTNVPSNLLLSVSTDEYKDEALLSLLMGNRFKSLDSIIVYCTRREEAARLSTYLRTKLQNIPTTISMTADDDINSTQEQCAGKRKQATKATSRKRRIGSWEVDCYHAGMSAAERKRVQNKFIRNQLRIVVATVAFGMGIDKHDVRGVIHYNMPRSFERYVQEIGRAGRDGLPAQCHLFLDVQGGDLAELSRHSYGKTVDRYPVKLLAKKIFQPCSCTELPKKCLGHLTAMSIDATVEELDLNREGIDTLLCYLEMESLIEVYLPTYNTCVIHCYEGPQQMLKVAKKCRAVALALVDSGSKERCGSEVEFSLVKIANRLNEDVYTLKRSLRNLVWDTTLSLNGFSGKSGVTVDFRDLSFHVRTKQEGTNELIDSVTSSLHERILKQERKELFQLRKCFETLRRFSFRNAGCCLDAADVARSDDLKSIINLYFKEEEEVPAISVKVQLDDVTEADIRATVRQFITIHGGDFGSLLSGRSIARILQGIESPRFPARTWGRARRFWRSKIGVDFNALVKIATEELVKFR